MRDRPTSRPSPDTAKERKSGAWAARSTASEVASQHSRRCRAVMLGKLCNHSTLSPYTHTRSRTHLGAGLVKAMQRTEMGRQQINQLIPAICVHAQLGNTAPHLQIQPFLTSQLLLQTRRSLFELCFSTPSFRCVRALKLGIPLRLVVDALLGRSECESQPRRPRVGRLQSTANNHHVN